MNRLSGSFKIYAAAALAIGGLILPLSANAVQVQVGYADNLRPSPFFPNPFAGDPGVTLYAGQNPSVGIDAWAVRVFNDTASNFVINSLTVHMRNGAGTNYDLWSGFLGAGFTLTPGSSAIFTQTAQFNFDSSDGDVLIGGNDIANNCSVGALSLTAACTNNPAQVILNGSILLDTGHVLDTGGFDSVGASVCPNRAEPSGACNESLQWRLIGTTGINNPGGTSVPEPASLLLLGSGLVGLAAWRIRRNK